MIFKKCLRHVWYTTLEKEHGGRADPWRKRKNKKGAETTERGKRSREKGEKGTRGKKLKGAVSKKGNCERSKEHGSP